MKPKSFLLSLLLLPYLGWAIAAVFSLVLVWPILYGFGIFAVLLNEIFPSLGTLEAFRYFGWFLKALVGITFAYFLTVVFWGVPYTIIVISMFIWSKNKSTEQTYKALFYSPCLLALLSVAGILSVFLISRISLGAQILQEDWRNIGLISLLITTLCLVCGYFFVGLGMVGYKLLSLRKILKSEDEITVDDLKTVSKIE